MLPDTLPAKLTADLPAVSEPAVMEFVGKNRNPGARCARRETARRRYPPGSPDSCPQGHLPSHRINFFPPPIRPFRVRSAYGPSSTCDRQLLRSRRHFDERTESESWRYAGLSQSESPSPPAPLNATGCRPCACAAPKEPCNGTKTKRLPRVPTIKSCWTTSMIRFSCRRCQSRLLIPYDPHRGGVSASAILRGVSRSPQDAYCASGCQNEVGSPPKTGGMR